MQPKKCLRTLASALIIAAAALASSGAETARTYKIIHQFELPKEPMGNLTIDAAGNLYGTTYQGGDTTACTIPFGGCGLVWKLAPNPDGTWGTLTVLYEFTGGADGAYPTAGLIVDAAGNLYGTTTDGGRLKDCSGGTLLRGCGVVFKLAPNPDGIWTESVLHTFTGAPDGSNPDGGLIFDATGSLYGTTWLGGDATACGGGGCGTVFKLAPNPDGIWTESVLHTFTGGADGAFPSGGLIFDAAGNLYGTTIDGGGGTACGSGGCGTVFKLAPNPDGIWTESVLHTFTGVPDAASPNAGLIFNATGNLYGTTVYGGAAAECYYSSQGCGVVFKLAPNSDGTWAESVLYSFTGGADGSNPDAGLIFDAAGNLYGTTEMGGDSVCTSIAQPYFCGVVFKLTPTSSGWSETVLRKFLGQARFPQSPLIFDPKGNLYGTTPFGTGNYGVVFEITP